MVSRLAHKKPPILTLIDGIYSNERGAGFEGRIHRSNFLVASYDVFSADLAGSRILGFEPSDVPHLAYAGMNRKRSRILHEAIHGQAGV